MGNLLKKRIYRNQQYSDGKIDEEFEEQRDYYNVLLQDLEEMIYSMIKYGFILLGLTWIMRGNNNFLKLG